MNAAGHAQSRTSVQRESWQQKSSSAEAELPERFLRVAAPSIRFVPWAALASCWPRPQQLLPVSAAGGGRRRCTCRTEVRKAVPLTRDVAHLSSAGKLATKKQFCRSRTAKFAIRGKSALAELRCATSGFEAVFLSFFHSGVTGQEAGLLEDGAQLGIVLEQSPGQAMTESAGLSGNRRAAE